MTYKELYEKAIWLLEHNEINGKEYDKMIEPLNAEVGNAEPVRHGRYIHDTIKILDDDTGDEPIYVEEDRYTCSECGKKYLRFAPDYNYCPNCGAKMEREEE